MDFPWEFSTRLFGNERVLEPSGVKKICFPNAFLLDFIYELSFLDLFLAFSVAFYFEFSFVFSIRLFGKERVVEPAGVRGYADVCLELHYGQVQHH